jgi:hypothetical protein
LQRIVGGRFLTRTCRIPNTGRRVVVRGKDQLEILKRWRKRTVFPAGSGPSIARIRSGTALEEMTPVWRVRSRRAGDAYPVGAVRGAGASRAAGAFNPTRPGSFRQCGETQARNKLVYTVAATVPLSCVSAGMFVPCRPVVVAQEHARGSGTAANLLALSPTLNPQPSQNPE